MKVAMMERGMEMEIVRVGRQLERKRKITTTTMSPPKITSLVVPAAVLVTGSDISIPRWRVMSEGRSPFIFSRVPFTRSATLTMLAPLLLETMKKTAFSPDIFALVRLSFNPSTTVAISPSRTIRPSGVVPTEILRIVSRSLNSPVVLRIYS